jgi:hypothetical protein
MWNDIKAAFMCGMNYYRRLRWLRRRTRDLQTPF